MFKYNRKHQKWLLTPQEPRVNINRSPTLSGDYRAHNHDYLELVLVLKGTASHYSILGRQPLQAGDVIALRPGTWHAYEKCRRFRYCVCGIGPEIISRELAWTMREPVIGDLLWNGLLAPRNKGIIIFHLDNRTMKRTGKLWERLEQLTYRHTIRRAAKIIAGLLLLLDELGNQYSPGHRALHPPDTSPAVVKAIQILEADLPHPWTRRELGARVYMDPAHLGRLFKQTTGLAPLHYLARLRAERAASLLIHTDKSVGAIGVEVGWPEPFYFARRFKTYFSMTATEYRRRFIAPSLSQGRVSV